MDSIAERIQKLKVEKNALILAHNYQLGEIQEIADVVGDSYMLSKIAQTTDKEMIVFCGVHFMAESAKILNPFKKVILANPDAGCPMADMITGEDLVKFREENPGVPIVAYVNTSAAVKAQSDICCTSSNAVDIVNSMVEKKILFVPDRNLGTFVSRQVPEKEVMLWNGFCITHERIEAEEMFSAKQNYPDAEILMHPECNPVLWEYADYIGSTSQIIEYAVQSDHKTFIIATEAGILFSLNKLAPDKTFHLLSPCLVCQNMKKTTLMDVENALSGKISEIVIDEALRLRAERSLIRMLNGHV